MDYSQFLKYQQCMPENVITQLRYSRGENVSQRLYRSKPIFKYRGYKNDTNCHQHAGIRK